MGMNGNHSAFVPEIVLLLCRNCRGADADIASISSKTDAFSLRASMLPCSSKVEVSALLKIFESGDDGVEVVGCGKERCRFLTGSTKASQRIQYTCRLLNEAGLGAERLGMVHSDVLSADALVELARLRAAAVMDLGPNPMKRRRQP